LPNLPSVLSSKQLSTFDYCPRLGELLSPS
jgi:hypothetical protein